MNAQSLELLLFHGLCLQGSGEGAPKAQTYAFSSFLILLIIISFKFIFRKFQINTKAENIT